MKHERIESDYYPTPPSDTNAYLSCIMQRKPECLIFGNEKLYNISIYDPFAGEGAILAEAKKYGFNTIATELREECREPLSEIASEIKIADILWKPEVAISIISRPDVIVITNPPFSKAIECLDVMIEGLKQKTACCVDCEFCGVHSMFRKSFFGTQFRSRYLKKNMPTYGNTLTKRPSFAHGKTDNSEYDFLQWCRNGHTGKTKFDFLFN